MKHIPQIKSVMTPFPYFVGLTSTLRQAKQVMSDRAIRHLPVMDDHRLVGMLTDRDIKLILGPETDGQSQDAILVKDVFIEKIYMVELTEPLDNVLLHMANNHIGSALVTKDGRLAGLFTVTDACKYFGEFLREHFLPLHGNDAA
ncbi:MAG: CBS domain-containing protein [Pseudomonadota bacterium]